MLGTKVCSRHPPAQRFSEVCVALENDWRSLLERLKGSVEEMAVQVCVHSVALITTVISLCLQIYYTVVKLFHSSLDIPVPLHFRTGTNMASRSGALHAGVSVDSSPAGRRSLQDGRAGRAHNGLEPSSGGEKHHPVVLLRPYRAPVVGSNRTRCSSFVFGWRQKPACSTCALSFKTMRSCCFRFIFYFYFFLIFCISPAIDSTGDNFDLSRLSHIHISYIHITLIIYWVRRGRYLVAMIFFTNIVDFMTNSHSTESANSLICTVYGVGVCVPYLIMKP